MHDRQIVSATTGRSWNFVWIDVNRMTTIVAFSPHAAWQVHSNYETTIMRACQLRGARVLHILCDAMFAECSMHNISKTGHGRPLDLCNHCQRDAKGAIESAGLTYKWLSEFVTPQERTAIFDWVQSLHPKKFQSSHFQGFPIGEMVSSSVVSTFRKYPIDLTDYFTTNVYRGYLQAGAAVLVGLSRAFEQQVPTSLVIFNGRNAEEKIALELAKQRCIRVLTHETTRVPGTMWVGENVDCTNPEPFQRFWQAWKEIPLTRLQLEGSANWLRARRHHLSCIDYHCTTRPNGAQKVIDALNLGSYERVIALFTSSTDEIEGNPDITMPFPSHEQWVQSVVDWIEERPTCCLVIRTHPCLSGQVPGVGRSAFLIDWYNQLASRLPSNARLVMPDDPMSTYDLMDAADFGITYGSTCGLEMLALGKPVAVVPGFALYQNVPGVVLLDNPATLPRQLEQLLLRDTSRELSRYAFRCIYRYFFHMVVPFSLVSMTGLYTSKLNYSSTDEIRQVNDEGLGRICDFLLDGSPIHPTPQPIDDNRTQDEEDAFFRELEAIAEEPEQVQIGSSGRVEPATAGIQQERADLQVSRSVDRNPRTSHPIPRGVTRLLRKAYRSCQHNLQALRSLLVRKR